MEIRSDCLRQMILFSRQMLPEEACGLAAGRKSNDQITITRIYCTENIDHSPMHFSVSPEEHLKLILDIRKSDLDFIGCWHSHPRNSFLPSEEDHRLAFDPKAHYLILSLMDNRPELASYHVCGGRLEREEIKVVN